MLQALVKAVREAEGLSDPLVPGNSITMNSILRAYKPVFHVSSQSDMISFQLNSLN
jgi:hypothetical protein